MRPDLLHGPSLVLASVAIGCIGWSGDPQSLPLAALFPVLWSKAATRRQATAVSAAYFLAASRGLPEGVANFYTSDIWPGLILWLSASTGFVLVHAAFWVDQSDWKRPWRFLIASMFMAVPPFGVFGWAHPVTAAGILFPAAGWWGLMAMMVILILMTTRLWPATAVVVAGFWLLSLASWEAPKRPQGWSGIDLVMGASLGREAGFARQRQLVEIALAYPPGSHVVLPENALGFLTPTVGRIWQAALKDSGMTVIAGAALVHPGGYDNVLVKLSAGESEVLYRQRMPVPGSMWQPWRSLNGAHGGARAHVFANPVVHVDGVRLAVLLCYEQLLIWPVLQSASHRPDVILAVGNGWWTAGTRIVSIQRASSEAWSRLFDLPLVFSFNT